MKNRASIYCDCSDPYHNIVFDVCEYTNGTDIVHSELAVYVRMNPYIGFFGRLKNAIGYVFKAKSSRYDYEETIISNKESLLEMRNMIDIVLESEYK